MRIAIVDDNPAERRELAKRVQSVLEKRGRAAAVLEYGDGAAFLTAARAERFQLAFLDIYMEGLDGVSAAKELREFDPGCALVFTTTSTDHALDGYRVRAMQYLVKPYTAGEVEQVFDELSRLLPPPEKYIEVKAGRQTVRVRLGEILYAEHFQHQIHIHTRDGGETVTRMTFGDFSALLSGEERFFVCGRGVLVNLEYASDYDGSVFLVGDGTSVPVSRELSEKARSAFGEYLFRRGRRAKR